MRSVLHLSKYAAGRGGMDNVLRLHAAHGERCVALLSRPRESPQVGVLGAGASVHAPLAWLHHCARSRIQQQTGAGASILYYNCWGADGLARLDGAGRRIAYLHNQFPALANYLRYFSPFFDGFVCVSPQMADAVRACLPHDARDRCHAVPLPVDDVFFAAGRETAGRGPVIGFCGRIVRAQKRVERLSVLVAALEQTRREFSLEIVGDGPDRAWLEESFADNPRVRFHGWRTPAEVAELMRHWRYTANVSDYEGQSIALLESMAAGCVPLYPDFHGGAELPAALGRWCLYPAGDVMALAMRWNELEEISELARAELRQGLATHAAQHRSENYLSAFRARVEEIEQLPARVASAAARRSGVSAVAPIWAYNRFYRRLTGD